MSPWFVSSRVEEDRSSSSLLSSVSEEDLHWTMANTMQSYSTTSTIEGDTPGTGLATEAGLVTGAVLATGAGSLVADASLSSSNATDEVVVPCSEELFFFLVYGPIYGLVCGFGLIGNALSFAILHKYSKDNVSTFLLKALAIMDNVFLGTAAFVQMYPAMVIHLGHTAQLTPIYTYFQTFAWPLAHIVQLGTVWMVVLVAANRYIAVCRPLHAARLCSKRNIQRQIAVMLICIFVYNIPRFVEYRYITVTSVVDNVTSDREENVGLASFHLYNILYENIAYCLFAYLLPLGILVVLNVHLVQELKRAQRSRQALLGRASAEEHNITLVMIIIIVSFIVCETPASINQILFYLVDDYQRRTCSTYSRYYHISNLLITTNSALNFAIYCLFRRQFRQELQALVCQRPGGGRKGRGLLRRTVVLRALHRNSSPLSCSNTDSYSRQTVCYSLPRSHDQSSCA